MSCVYWETQEYPAQLMKGYVNIYTTSKKKKLGIF